MLLVLVQATAEYLLIVVQNAGQAVLWAGQRVYAFVSTPKGLMIALAVIVFLSLTIGRRRRL